MASTAGKIRQMGILGGTFDPVHFGHLLIAEQARERFYLDQVRWIPAAVAPHAELKRATDAEHRMEMVKLAIAGNAAFVADDREIRRGGNSYTVDTLMELKTEFPEAHLVFLMGADSLREFGKWRRPRDVCEMAQVVVVARGGQPQPDLLHFNQFLDAPKDIATLQRDHLLPMPQVEISSSDLRARVQSQRSIRYQLPAAVDAYIQQHGLYSA